MTRAAGIYGDNRLAVMQTIAEWGPGIREWELCELTELPRSTVAKIVGRGIQKGEIERVSLGRYAIPEYANSGKVHT